MASNGGVLKHVFTVGAFTSLSRVLGLIREMLQSRLIGAGVEQSAFTIAFAIPNMSRKLFGEGALTAAFVPVFKGELETNSIERATKLARAVMTMTFLMLGSLMILAMGSLEVIVNYCEELGVHDMPRFNLTIKLIKTLLPYMIFICGAAFGMGVLNAMGRFKASSFMPCLLNLVWIGMLSLIAFNPQYSLEQRVHSVAIAILTAGAAQMVFMLWRMKCVGISPKPTFSGWRDEKVRLVWRNVGIAAVGSGAIQINYMLDQVLAQFASPWAAGVIGYAERLMDLPLGVIGVAFGAVLLPTFAGCFAKGDIKGAQAVLSSSVSNLMFIMLPSAAGLFILAPEITAVVYQGGDFTSIDTIRVSRALAVYALGLGFFGFQKAIVPYFQAQNDMKTPLRVSVFTVILNASLNIMAVFLLPEAWRHVGLALSTVVCALVGVVILVVIAKIKAGRIGLSQSIKPSIKALIGAIIMAFAVMVTKKFFSEAFLNEDFSIEKIIALALEIFVGIMVYGVYSVVLMRERISSFIRKRLNK